MRKQGKHIVLKDSVLRDDVWKVADQNDWAWIDEIEQREGTPYEIIWVANFGQMRVHYIEDFLANVNYFFLEQEFGHSENMDQIIEQIKSGVDIYTDEELLDMLEEARSPEEYIYAIYRVGVAAPLDPSPDFHRALKSALAYPIPAVRLAAIEAASYVTWDEIKQLINEIERTDPDPNVREQASILLEAYKKYP